MWLSRISSCLRLDRLPQDNRAETEVILSGASQQVDSTESNPRTDRSSRDHRNRSRTPTPNTDALLPSPTDHGSQVVQPSEENTGTGDNEQYEQPRGEEDTPGPLTETQDREGEEEEEELLNDNNEELEAGSDHNDIQFQNWHGILQLERTSQENLRAFRQFFCLQGSQGIDPDDKIKLPRLRHPLYQYQAFAV
ncbi:hypothetical protein BDW62DRAFT_31406 [Aspergillus aurantiobrunneus]